VDQELATAASQLSSAHGEYRINAGDELELRFFNLPELTQTVAVRPDGRIGLLFIHDLKVENMTVAEATSRIQELYCKHFRSPRVAVIVREFANRNVYVGGEVSQPGIVPMNMPLTLMGAVFRAGGFRETADVHSVVLMRKRSDGESERMEVDAEQVLIGKRPDIPLRALDVLFVRKATLNVYVGGEVEKPGLVTVMGRTTLASAVLQAGGTKASARLKDVVLLRDEGGKPSVQRINLQAILTKGEPDLPLKPFDVVFLPKNRIGKVNQFIDSYIRQVIPFQLGFSYLMGAQIF
jgi:protein involved in polysaccharide export with SLBB domain